MRRGKEVLTTESQRSTARGAQPEPRSPARVRLVIVHAPVVDAIGTSIWWAGSPIAIGRGDVPTGDGEQRIAVRDSRLSRVHAAIEEDAAGLRIRDCNSRNGTFVGRRRVGVAPLAHGDVVRAGDTLLLVDVVPAGGAEGVPEDEGPLLGRSRAAGELRAELRILASHDAPVLVLGETGVGKEIVAREIHRRSGRAGPFVAVNAGALPEPLAESELFGHVAGAFTGATRARNGCFVEADGGTLLLDEIGEMPRELQPKILRALATREVQPVGASAARPFDARVVAATNRDLGAAVAAGTFRADLYARLAGWIVRVPPLRERRDDVLLLAAGVLAREGGPAALTADAAEILVTADWPFNVRQLENAVSVAAARARAAGTASLDAGHLPPELAAPAPAPAVAAGDDDRPSKERLLEVAARHGGNLAEVARFFGRNRRQVYRWLKMYGIDARSLRRR